MELIIVPSPLYVEGGLVGVEFRTSIHYQGLVLTAGIGNICVVIKLQS